MKVGHFLVMVIAGLAHLASAFADDVEKPENQENPVLTDAGIVVVVSRSASGEVTHARLLDLHEDEELGSSSVDFGSSDLGVAEKLDLVLNRLTALDPARAKRWRERGQALLNNPSLSDSKIILKGNDGVPIPHGFQLEKLDLVPSRAEARSDLPKLSREIWSIFKGIQKDSAAAAALHFVIGEELAGLGESRASVVRALTVFFAGTAISEIGRKDYFEKWQALKLPSAATYEFGGIPLLVSSIELDPDENIVSGKTENSTEISFHGFPAQIKGSSDVRFRVGTSEIESADFESARWVYGDRILKIKGPVEVSVENRLKLATLAERTPWVTSMCEFSIPEDTEIRLFPEGSLERAVFPEKGKADLQFCFPDGKKIGFIRPLGLKRVAFDFHRNGVLKSGFLAQDTDFALFDGIYRFSRLARIYFHPNGRVARGQLSYGKVDLTSTGRTKKTYYGLPVLTFDPEGRVISEMP